MKSKSIENIPLSILDLVPVLDGISIAQSFSNSLNLAQRAEQLGYKRFWMSEHHGMDGVASSATVVLIGFIAANTKTIRVGSGGIMLPNHAPLVVAEQFGSLETLYPDRIDLGLGRAPGTDQITATALRRNMKGSIDDFPSNVVELKNYFTNQQPGKVKAVPGKGLDIPIWLLGSSNYSAQLAGMLGLPFAFASHFAPAMLHNALKVYRDNFKPSATLSEPYAIACVNVVAADTNQEAEHLATSLYAFFLNVIRSTSYPLRPPVYNMDALWNEGEKYAVQQMLQYTFIGDADKVKTNLSQFISSTGIDELMVVSNIFDHETRFRSYEILAGFTAKEAIKIRPDLSMINQCS